MSRDDDSVVDGSVDLIGAGSSIVLVGTGAFSSHGTGVGGCTLKVDKGLHLVNVAHLDDLGVRVNITGLVKALHFVVEAFLDVVLVTTDETEVHLVGDRGSSGSADGELFSVFTHVKSSSAGDTVGNGVGQSVIFQKRVDLGSDGARILARSSVPQPSFSGSIHESGFAVSIGETIVVGGYNTHTVGVVSLEFGVALGLAQTRLLDSVSCAFQHTMLGVAGSKFSLASGFVVEVVAISVTGVVSAELLGAVSRHVSSQLCSGKAVLGPIPVVVSLAVRAITTVHGDPGVLFGFVAGIFATSGLLVVSGFAFSSAIPGGLFFGGTDVTFMFVVGIELGVVSGPDLDVRVVKGQDGSGSVNNGDKSVHGCGGQGLVGSEVSMGIISVGLSCSGNFLIGALVGVGVFGYISEVESVHVHISSGSGTAKIFTSIFMVLLGGSSGVGGFYGNLSSGNGGGRYIKTFGGEVSGYHFHVLAIVEFPGGSSVSHISASETDIFEGRGVGLVAFAHIHTIVVLGASINGGGAADGDYGSNVILDCEGLGHVSFVLGRINGVDLVCPDTEEIVLHVVMSSLLSSYSRGSDGRSGLKKRSLDVALTVGVGVLYQVHEVDGVVLAGAISIVINEISG